MHLSRPNLLGSLQPPGNLLGPNSRSSFLSVLGGLESLTGMLGLVPPPAFVGTKGSLRSVPDFIHTVGHLCTLAISAGMTSWRLCCRRLMSPVCRYETARMSLRWSVEALVVRALNLATPAFPNFRFLASNPDG